MACACAVAAFVLSLASPAHAAGSGQRGGPSLPGVKATPFPSLTYDGFNNGNCSQTSFAFDVTAHYNINGFVIIEATTLLDGVFYDTLTFTETGPTSFPTDFTRTFTPPPPASSTYRFEFHSVVRQGELVLGTSVTTIVCTNGVLTASNKWLTVPESVPALHPALMAMLALLLAAAGLARQRAGRA